MRPRMSNARLPYQFRQFGPGPGRWGWIFRLRASSFRSEKSWEITCRLQEAGYAWNVDFLVRWDGDVFNSNDIWVYVGVRNDPKMDRLIRLLRRLHGRLELVHQDTWWDRPATPARECR